MDPMTIISANRGCGVWLNFITYVCMLTSNYIRCVYIKFIIKSEPIWESYLNLNQFSVKSIGIVFYERDKERDICEIS